MAFNIKNYVKERISAYNSNIDTRDGSVVSDLLINPLSFVLNKYNTEHETILSTLGITSPEELTEEEMDRIGLQYLMTRLSGTTSSGSIYVYFNSPTAVSIPRGTIFTCNEQTYRTIQDFYLSRTAVEQNLEDYYYLAGPIVVISVEPTDVDVPANSTFNTNFSFLLTPAKIINKTSFTAGTAKETNAQFFFRIKNTLSGQTLSSPAAIKAAILAYNPNLTRVDIIGAGSPFMQRDIITNYQSEEQRVISDFAYAVSGQHTDVFDNPNIAYDNIFTNFNSTSEASFPSLDSWSSEFTTDNYKKIYLSNDSNFVESNRNILIQDFVLSSGYSNTQGFTNAADSWYAHDAINTNNELFNKNEVRFLNSSVVLGYSEPEDISNITLNYKKLKTLLNDGDTNTLINLLNTTPINNYAPVFHKTLSQHFNIGVQCKVKTTDNTELGEMSYITVLRNSTKFAAHDGFGLAWQKQPEFLLRMQANNYGSNNALLQSDLLKFQNEYGQSGVGYLGHIKEHPEFWKYNVFLVDNNILDEKLFVNYEQILDLSNGINQFIQAAKVWIEPNISYYVQYYITEGFGFEAWFGEDLNEFNETNRILYKGPSYTNYVTVSGDKTINAITGVLSIAPERNNFGFGVLNTRNCEWTYSELKVWSIAESIPMHLFTFKINTADFNVLNGINVDYYGMGFDNLLVRDPEYTGKRSKVTLGIYNFNTNQWDILGSHQYDPIRNILEEYGPEPLVLDNIKISVSNFGTLSNYINSITGRVYIAAMASNIGVGYYPDNINHTLRTYYIAINNGQDTSAHRGNCTDIYCYDPSNLKRGSVVTTLSDATINLKNLSGVNGFIHEILGVKEYITQLDIPGSEYVVNNLSLGHTYSNIPDFQIKFNDSSRNGALIEIYYRYWDKGLELENAIINDETRHPFADYAIKTSPSIIVNISKLEYSGTVDVKTIKAALKTYINNLDTTRLDKSDLVNVLYNNGANYVNLDMIITLRQYDINMKNTLKVFNEQSYDIADFPAYALNKFYTDEYELSGVTKLA